jgi:predicted ABC-class ATPase
MINNIQLNLNKVRNRNLRRREPLENQVRDIRETKSRLLLVQFKLRKVSNRRNFNHKLIPNNLISFCKDQGQLIFKR